MKRLIAAMTLVMVLVSMFFGSMATAAQTTITGLKAMPYSATQVKVSWQGDASVYEVYYKPVDRGLEIKLKDKLDRLRAAREQARAQRK